MCQKKRQIFLLVLVLIDNATHADFMMKMKIFLCTLAVPTIKHFQTWSIVAGKW